jgi:hypothetical protein
MRTFSKHPALFIKQFVTLALPHGGGGYPWSQTEPQVGPRLFKTNCVTNMALTYLSVKSFSYGGVQK